MLNNLRRGLLVAIVAASLTVGVVLAPIAGAAPSAGARHSAPVTNGHFRPFPGCPGLQVGC